MEEQHKHIVVWPGDGHFYCLSCGQQLTGEQAYAALGKDKTMIDPIIIPMEDDLIHTDKNPFCDDPTCPCHHETKHRHVAVWLRGAYGHSLYYCFQCESELTNEEVLESLASCDGCEKAFEHDDPQCYFELGEYAYCGDCCKED